MNKVTYDKFYYTYGVRHATDVGHPKLVDLSIIELPKFSILHYYDSVNLLPSETNLKKLLNNYVLFNVLEYSRKDEHSRVIPHNESKFVKELNKTKDMLATTSHRLSLMLKKLDKVLKKDILVYNYSYINDYYKYKTDPLIRYYKYRNTYTTMVDTIKSSIDEYNSVKLPIKHYIYIGLPDLLYGLNIIKKYIDKDINVEMLKVFNTEKYLLLLDIFRLFTDSKESSVFYSLTEKSKYVNNINLIIGYKNNNVIVNLKTLLSFSKQYEYDGVKSSDDVMLHLVLNMFRYVIENTKDDDNLEVVKSMISVDEIIATKHIDDSESIVGDVVIDPEYDKKIVLDTITYINKKEELEKEDIIKEKSSLDTTHLTLEEMLDNKVIDKNKYNKLKTMIDTFNNSKIEGIGKVKDIIEYDVKEYELDRKAVKIPTSIKVVKNDKMLEDTTRYIEHTYITKELKKDIVRTFVELQKTGIIVKDMDIEHVDNVLGEYDAITLNVSDKGKATNKVVLTIPTIKENGTFVISGNRYFLKKQRNELPIKKISNTRVVLTSAKGKVNVTKAPMKRYDIGYKLKNYLNKLYLDDSIDKVLYHTGNYMDIKLPQDYYTFGRYIKNFTKDGYILSFDYKNRDKFSDDIEKLEKDGVVVGSYKKKPIVMKFDNQLYIDNKSIGDIYKIIGLDRNFHIEYTFIKVFNVNIPVGIILSYYLGLNKLLGILGVRYGILDGNKRVYEDDAIIVKTSDKTIILYIDNILQRNILGGLNHDPKVMKNITYDTLNNKLLFKTIFRELNYNLATTTEIDILENGFVDIVTKKTLDVMGEPNTFIGLLMRSTELLEDDYYQDPTNIETSIVKGYERIPQYLHKVLLTAISNKRNAEFFGSSAKLTVDPYSVWKMMNEDNASELVDDLNPIAYIKQKEDVTYLGIGGRSKESMPVSSRKYNKDDVGVISESVKDNTDVAITAYLSANPAFTNMLGMAKGKPKDLDYSNIYSTNTMLTPFLLTDDPKRIIYSAIQASGLIPIDEPILFPVRTPYANVLVYKMDKNFADYVKEDGKVKKVTKHSVTIEFKDSKKTYKFQDWTSKEEGGITFVHKMVTNLKEGETVKSGDVVYYDSGFFEKDMFDPHKVVYRTGRPVLTTMISSEDTREDAFTISDRLHTLLASSNVVVRDVTLTNTDNIKEVLEVGKDVTNDDILFTIVSDIVGDEKLDKETLDLLQGFVKNTPKVNNNGKVIAVKVFYNCEYKELSRSLKKLVDMSKKYMVDTTTGKEYDGMVNSSYSINGKPLVSGGVHVKYYIEVKDAMNTGDKGIFANQLKATVTTVTKHKMYNESGEELDAKLDFTGIYNRIVPSAELLGTTAKVLDIITKKAIEIYEG